MPNVKIRKSNPILCSSTVLFTLFAGISGSYAQPSPSISGSYEFFPFSKLTDPDPGTFEQDLEVRVATFYTEFSAPAVFSEGRTVLVNTLSYHSFDLDYKNWDDLQGGSKIENAKGIEYSLTLVRQFSEKWNLTAVVTPGLHSDFNDGISNDDFNVSSAVIFGRQISQNFSLGFGAAYSFKFGEAFPIPLLTLQWTSGSSSRVDLLLPVQAELWYLPSRKLELGLAARIGGNQYHGDPARFSVKNPQMRYSIGTVGPSLKFLLKGIHLTVDGGVTLLRRFEFFDGKVEQNSLDLENSGFVRAGIKLLLSDHTFQPDSGRRKRLRRIRHLLGVNNTIMA